MYGTDLAEQREWKTSAHKGDADENKAMWTAELQEFSGSQALRARCRERS